MIDLELETINTGIVANDGSGDPLKVAGDKINRNTSKLNDAIEDLDGQVESIFQDLGSIDQRVQQIEAGESLVLQGDITGSGSGQITTTLSSTGVVAGTYIAASLVIDSKGRVTYAVSLQDSTNKLTLANADEIPVTDSVSNFSLKRLTWSSLKNAIKDFTDTQYTGLSNNLTQLSGLSPSANDIPYFNNPTTAALLRLDNDTALTADSATRIATQHAVKSYIDNLVGSMDAMTFRGVINASTNPNYPAANQGYTYRISVAGKIGGPSGPNVEVGDILICLTDGTISGDHATVGSNWTIIQANIDGAVIGPSTSSNLSIPLFSGTSGKLIQDSGVFY